MLLQTKQSLLTRSYIGLTVLGISVVAVIPVASYTVTYWVSLRLIISVVADITVANYMVTSPWIQVFSGHSHQGISVVADITVTNEQLINSLIITPFSIFVTY